MRLAISTLALAACAGTAAAQCNVYKYGVPDFDQRRGYLPGNGSMYCVPTSTVNWMGYIANHGQPQALNHASSNWASMSEYAFVNVRDFNMGGFMDTDPSGGTDMGDAVDGSVDYMDYYGVGPALVMGYIADEDWQVSPKMMHDALKIGWLVNMVYGRYQLDGDQWERTGGHCVSLCAVQDACNSSAARVGFKDPNTDPASESINSQSAFATKWWDITRQQHNFDGDVYKQWGPAGQNGSTIRYIDKVMYIVPLFVLTQDNFGALVKFKAALLNNDPEPAITLVNLPDHAPLLFALNNPRTPSSIVVTGPIGINPAKVWEYNHADDKFTPVLNLPGTPGAFTLGKRGEIILEINGDIYKYQLLGDGSVRLLGTARAGFGINSLAVNDKTDDIYALGAAQRRLLKFPGGDLAANPFNGMLPANLPLGQGPAVAMNPADGKVWLCSEGSPLIFQLTEAVTAPAFLISDSLQTGGGSKPTALQFGDHGEMKFISGGKIHEFDRAGEKYIPTHSPIFDGMEAKGFLGLARSRTNFDPRLHTGPAWANLENPDPEPLLEVIDCPADINGDGFVDGIDYDTFNNMFEAGDINADFNFDGFVDGIDYDDFNNAFEKGC